MILITGATGYIGRHLVSRLVARGDRPRCLVRNIDRAAQILPAYKVELIPGARFVNRSCPGHRYDCSRSFYYC